MPRRAAIIVLLGLGLGTFSVLGEGLPINAPTILLVALANAVGPWIVVAFAAGAVGASAVRGAVAGSVALSLAVLTYYVGVQLRWGDVIADPVRATAVWAFVALAVGTLVGAAGGAWKGAGDRSHARSVALLSGLLLAEAVARFADVEGWTGIDLGRTALQVAAVDLSASVLALFVLLDGPRRRMALPAALVIGLVAGAAIALAIPAIRGAANGG